MPQDTTPMGQLIVVGLARRRMTPQDLADAAGVSRNAVYKWQRGGGAPEVYASRWGPVLGYDAETLGRALLGEYVYGE